MLIRTNGLASQQKGNLHPTGTLLLRSQGLLETCRVWERLEHPANSSEQYSQTLTGCFPTADSTEGFCLLFQIGVLPDNHADKPHDQEPLTAVLQILADCKPKVELLTRTQTRGQSAWLQVIQTECLLADTKRTTLRVHVAQPVSLISFRLNIQSRAPVCTVCISALSLPVPVAPLRCVRPITKLPVKYQPWLAIIQCVNLETVMKLGATCKSLRQIMEATFAGGGGLINRYVRRHSLDARKAVRDFASPVEDCSVFALEDQALFQSERVLFANLLLNTFTFICEIFTQPKLPMQLFYGARHERISSGPSLTFETWIDEEAKHTIHLIVITPPPIQDAQPDKTPFIVSLQMRLL